MSASRVLRTPELSVPVLWPDGGPWAIATTSATIDWQPAAAALAAASTVRVAALVFGADDRPGELLLGELATFLQAGDALTDPLSVDEAVALVRTLARTHGLVLVVGVPGLLVPLGRAGWTLMDLAVAVSAPVVVVTGTGPDSANHASLALGAVSGHGLAATVITVGGPPAPVAPEALAGPAPAAGPETGVGPASEVGPASVAGPETEASPAPEAGRVASGGAPAAAASTVSAAEAGEAVPPGGPVPAGGSVPAGGVVSAGGSAPAGDAASAGGPVLADGVVPAGEAPPAGDVRAGFADGSAHADSSGHAGGSGHADCSGHAVGSAGAAGSGHAVGSARAVGSGHTVGSGHAGDGGRAVADHEAGMPAAPAGRIPDDAGARGADFAAAARQWLHPLLHASAGRPKAATPLPPPEPLPPPATVGGKRVVLLLAGVFVSMSIVVCGLAFCEPGSEVRTELRVIEATAAPRPTDTFPRAQGGAVPVPKPKRAVSDVCPQNRKGVTPTVPDRATTKRVNAAWKRIETWLAAHAPASRRSLRPPATAKEIAAVQRRMSVAFPPDLVASLLRHDGASGRGGGFTLPFFYQPMPVGQIAPEWLSLCTVLVDVFDEEDSGWWDKWYVPFASSGDGGNLLVDQSPGNHGRVGEFYNEDGVSFEDWPGSVAELLEKTAESLESGRPYDNKYRPRVTKDGALEWDVK